MSLYIYHKLVKKSIQLICTELLFILQGVSVRDSNQWTKCEMFMPSVNFIQLKMKNKKNALQKMMDFGGIISTLMAGDIYVLLC